MHGNESKFSSIFTQSTVSFRRQSIGEKIKALRQSSEDNTRTCGTMTGHFDLAYKVFEGYQAVF